MKNIANFSKTLYSQMFAVHINPDNMVSKGKWVVFITCHKYRVLLRSALNKW